jgi:CRISPR-associated endonuclease Csn1
MPENRTVLGLDIGVASIGWALADIDGKEIQTAGVRIFEAAMDTAKFEAGAEGASHAAARRQARLQRRQLRRRAARHRDLYLALQSAALLPFACDRAENRHDVLNRLDRDLLSLWRPRIRQQAPDISDPDQVLCYYLRARALEEKLGAYELGRALYHLGQRRGFKSNRREGRAVLNKNREGGEPERSEIKAAINGLAAELRATGMTLGQHLAKVNPHATAIRNRKRNDIPPIWTGRSMYEEEFERIWAAQTPHYPGILTEALHNRLHRLMFWQRGISPGKPGRCTFENADRAPRPSLLAQQFRMVQAVNNLRVREGNAAERRLKADERQRLLAILETAITLRGKKRCIELFGLRFADVKEKLNLPPRTKLNLDDEEADSYLRGNRTKALMARAFGEDRWKALGETEQRRVVRKWIHEQSPEKLLTALRQQWGLSSEAAIRLAETEPEDGYAALSHRAMLKLLPAMEGEGLTYAEAVAKLYPRIEKEPLAFLPPVARADLGHIPNPAVMRALTELHKVVNAIIRIHGKPVQIRLELARSLKRNAEQRERDWKANRKRERERKAAADLIRDDLHRKPSRDAIDRVLLYWQCGNVCVYCGNALGGLSEIFSGEAAVEVEHIFPRRCLDDSFSNKVLAHRTCNLKKGDRCPSAAFAASPEWQGILDRVAALDDRGKLERFHATEDDALDFSHRHLADTRYITKLAAEYLEQLYGGRDVGLPWEDRKRRVYASSGVLTAVLRRHWGLEAILKEPGPAANGQGGKARTDHRHHAVDAIVIALTSERMVQQASLDAQSHDRSQGYALPRFFAPPWPTTGDIEERVSLFKSAVQRVLDGIVVSHRLDHKLNGPLHKATYYSPKKGEDVFGRTEVQALTPSDIESENVIVDEKLRLTIRQKLSELDGNPKSLETSLPHLQTRRGPVPIRSVRIRIPGKKAEPVRPGDREPTVFAEGNHHVVVFATQDPKKGLIWYTPGPVTRWEAIRRKSKGFDVIRTSDGPAANFVFCLMAGDMVEMLDKVTGRRELYVLASLSDRDYAFLRHNKSVPSAKGMGLTLGQLRRKMQDAGDRLRISNLDELRVRNCRKVEVDPLGRVHYLKSGKQARGAVAE